MLVLVVCSEVRSWLWNTLEYPWTSRLAQLLAFFSLSMIVLSTLTFIISTADELQMDAEGESEWPVVVLIIEMTDNFVIVFFSLEFVIRLLICPNKLKFIRDPMNVIDICAIVPFYLSLLLEGLEDFEIIGKTGKMIRLVRVMRILRIFKLVRHFAGLQSLFYTLQQAYQVCILCWSCIKSNKKFAGAWPAACAGGGGHTHLLQPGLLR